jgi:hypothetical protein
MGAGQQVTLVIPGLCGPASSVTFLDGLTERFPALERLLSRSQQQRRAVNNLDTSLCCHFELQQQPGAGLPVAALTGLVDIDNLDAACVMRADPVHLRADQSALRLFDSRTFIITQEEADELTAAFNELYAEKGWCLKAPCPQRWYLSLPQAPAITTVSPGVIAGQDIDPHLPHGQDASEWHALMNEVQMLFHQHPVNALREERGAPAINSLWFWGEGALPGTIPRPDMQVATDYPLAMGLASLTHTPRCDVPASLEELLASTEKASVLVVLDVLEAAMQYREIETWLATLKQLELHWFSPLLEALGDGRVARVEIDPCNGKSYRTTRKQQRHFWKRVRPLSSACQQG